MTLVNASSIVATIGQAIRNGKSITKKITLKTRFYIRQVALYADELEMRRPALWKGVS
jgi:polyphosphate kinase